jgi:hypothetical protein
MCLHPAERLFPVRGRQSRWHRRNVFKTPALAVYSRGRRFLSARIKGKEHERIQIFYKAMVMLMPAAPNTIFHDYFEKRVS